MAQAAKQLKKIKDIEAQALQEQKEKEESNRKRRNRSRDRKKKVRGAAATARRQRRPEEAEGRSSSAEPGAGRGAGPRGRPSRSRRVEGAGREGSGEEASVRPEEDRAGVWKGRAGGAEAESARKPARALPAQPFQHPGQTPAGPRCAAPGGTFPASGGGGMLGYSAQARGLAGLCREAGLGKRGSGLRGCSALRLAGGDPLSERGGPRSRGSALPLPTLLEPRQRLSQPCVPRERTARPGVTWQRLLFLSLERSGGWPGGEVPLEVGRGCCPAWPEGLLREQVSPLWRSRGTRHPPAKAQTPQGNRYCVQRFPSGSGAFLPPTQSAFRNTFGERHLPL